MIVVALGPGSRDAVPAAALAAIGAAAGVYATNLPPGLAEAIGIPVLALDRLETLPEDAVIVAPDPEAYELVRRLPGAGTVPDREALRARAIGAEVARLVEVGAHLRRECPWDREQTAQTIVPHTVEEAFEVAEAVASGDKAKQVDELGDLLFQSVFLAQLLEEVGASDLGAIARRQADKLISRHPHVYGDAVAHGASGVRDLWERRKREERADQGIFHDLPPGLPALAYASKAQKRAAGVGFDFETLDQALEQLEQEVAELKSSPEADELGDVVFACTAVARRLGADVEIALRLSASRFRERVEGAARLAAAAGQSFEGLGPDAQLGWYRMAKEGEGP